MTRLHVELEHGAYLACMVHALTTEKEEVMGLLLGDIIDTGDIVINRIWDVIILRRSCKQRDRVEISAEQLAAASQEAEDMTNATGRTTRVIGWYHSHPHITVLPSHVDIATQATYQMMDKNFIGLIFSVFNKDKDNKGRIQVIAFQSQDNPVEEFDFTGDYSIGFESPQENSSNAPQGMLEVPMEIVKTNTQSTNVFRKLVSVQQILLEEERDTYTAASTTGNHPFHISYNRAIFDKAICCLLEYGFYPLTKLLEDKKKYYQEELAQRQKERDLLISKLKQLS